MFSLILIEQPRSIRLGRLGGGEERAVGKAGLT